jgi:hypothetical protein
VDALVTAAFGSVCAGGTPGRPPKGDFLVFKKERGSWQHQYRLAAALAWTPPWPAAICVTEGVSEAGRYVDSSGKEVGRGYETTWQVRLLRLSDGKTFETSVYGAPPGEATVYRGRAHGSGDPTSKLAAWLQTIH